MPEGTEYGYNLSPPNQEPASVGRDFTRSKFPNKNISWFAKRIEKDLPGIGDDFKDGLSLGKIFEKYELEITQLINIKNRGIAISSIREALISLLGEEQYKTLAKQHTLSTRKSSTQAAIEARGHTPISDPEKIMIKALAQLPEYRTGTKINTKKIAAAVNKEFHRKDLRTSDAISQFLSTEKKQSQNVEPS